MPLAFAALITVKNSFFAGDVECFYTMDSILISRLQGCTYISSLVIKIITFSSLTVECGQWGGRSVRLLLVGEMFWHPSGERSVTAQVSINNFPNTAV
jgi:hypothetical protein